MREWGTLASLAKLSVVSCQLSVVSAISFQAARLIDTADLRPLG